MLSSQNEETELLVPNPRKSLKLRRFFSFAFIGVLIFTALAAWAFASPFSSSADDGFHLSSIWCSGEGLSEVCEPGADPHHRKVAAVLLDAPTCFAFQPKVDASCQQKYGILDNFDLTETDVGNFSGGYPPLFYAFMHTFATKDIVFSAILMRLINVVIFTLATLILWAISPKSTQNIQRLLWIVTLVPLGLFVIASNNPSSWAIMGIGFSAMSLFAFFNTSETFRLQKVSLIFFYLVFTVMAAGSRGDSAAYVVVAALLISIATVPNWIRNKSNLFLPAIGTIVGLLFFLSSGHSGVAEEGFGESAEMTVKTPMAVLAYNLARFPNLFIGSFAGEEWGLGWLDTRMPETVWLSALGIFFSVLVISWQKMNRYSALALSASFASIAVIPLYVLQRSQLTIGQVVQPRYIYPLVILTAVISLATRSYETNFGSRYWRWFVAIAISVAGPLALYINMSRYIHGLEAGASYNLNSNPGWWWTEFPLQPMTVLILGSISFVCLVFIFTRPWSKTVQMHSMMTETSQLFNG